MLIRSQLLIWKIIALVSILVNIKLMFFSPCQPTACKRKRPCSEVYQEGMKHEKCWRRTEVHPKQPLWPNIDNMDRFVFSKEPVILGKRRPYKAYMAIGIPTVVRNGAFYLSKTLNSLIAHSSEDEKDEFVIVVCINEANNTLINEIVKQLDELFFEEVRDGLIQVISPNFSMYPPLKKLPLLYGDDDDRVKWRSKQSLDYSFLFYYCANLADYFVSLEDDVLAEPNFFKTIRTFSTSRMVNNWSMLEFGARGFIGKFYRTSHVKSLAKFIHFNYWTMPVDWLFRVFNSIFLTPENRNDKLFPPIFKHFGSISSLKGQKRKLEDFGQGNRKKKMYKHKYQRDDNPSASIETTISHFEYPYDISLPYGRYDFFWGKNVKKGDSITIRFPRSIYVKRIIIASGNEEHPVDILKDTELLVSYSIVCENFEVLKSYVGVALIDYTFTKVNSKVKCIRLQITDITEQWLLISEIAVLV